MEAKATHSGAKCTARKARLLRGLILGKPAAHAIALLSAERRAGSVATVKLIRSALAQLPSHAVQSAIIEQFIVNEGPRRRMFMPRAQGRASPILKKTSHLTICLSIK
jgi:large subunit ribosomal protein L22